MRADPLFRPALAAEERLRSDVVLVSARSGVVRRGVSARRTNDLLTPANGIDTRLGSWASRERVPHGHPPFVTVSTQGRETSGPPPAGSIAPAFPPAPLARRPAPLGVHIGAVRVARCGLQRIALELANASHIMGLKNNVTGLDELQRELRELADAIKSLDGRIGSLRFDPADTVSVEKAVSEMERLVDERAGKQRPGSIAESVISTVKAKYATQIRAKQSN